MGTMIKVRALRMGIYQGHAHNPGDIFDVDDRLFADVHDADAHHATFGWMEKVDEAKDKEAFDKHQASQKKSAEEDVKQKEAADKAKGLLPHQKTRDLAKEAQDVLDARKKEEESSKPYVPQTETKEQREKRESLENEKKNKSKEK